MVYRCCWKLKWSVKCDWWMVELTWLELGWVQFIRIYTKSFPFSGLKWGWKIIKTGKKQICVNRFSRLFLLFYAILNIDKRLWRNREICMSINISDIKSIIYPLSFHSLPFFFIFLSLLFIFYIFPYVHPIKFWMV